MAHQAELEPQEKELTEKLVQLEAEKSSAFKTFRKLLGQEDEVTLPLCPSLSLSSSSSIHSRSRFHRHTCARVHARMRTVLSSGTASLTCDRRTVNGCQRGISTTGVACTERNLYAPLNQSLSLFPPLDCQLPRILGAHSGAVLLG